MPSSKLAMTIDVGLATTFGAGDDLRCISDHPRCMSTPALMARGDLRPGLAKPAEGGGSKSIATTSAAQRCVISRSRSGDHDRPDRQPRLAAALSARALTDPACEPRTDRERNRGEPALRPAGAGALSHQPLRGRDVRPRAAVAQQADVQHHRRQPRPAEVSRPRIVSPHFSCTVFRYVRILMKSCSLNTSFQAGMPLAARPLVTVVRNTSSICSPYL